MAEVAQRKLADAQRRHEALQSKLQGMGHCWPLGVGIEYAHAKPRSMQGIQQVCTCGSLTKHSRASTTRSNPRAGLWQQVTTA
jgi:hypothetical protein